MFYMNMNYGFKRVFNDSKSLTTVTTSVEIKLLKYAVKHRKRVVVEFAVVYYRKLPVSE